MEMFVSKYFKMGKIVCTSTVYQQMLENSQFANDVASALRRYTNKDWGDLNKEDWKVNEDALKYPEDLYILAVYPTCKGKIYIITNRISEIAGDNGTTICFPEER